MGLFRASDTQIRDEVARLSADRDLNGLAAKLRKSDERWRLAAAAALAPFGRDAATAVVAETLGDEFDENAKAGAWHAFAQIGAPAAEVIIGRVASVDTLLAPDLRAALRYYQRAIAAIGPTAQDQVAALVRRNAPWRDIAQTCLNAEGKRPVRLNTDAVASAAILVPIHLGSQKIDLDEAEEAIRATSRQWAVTCLLAFAGDRLGEAAVSGLEEAVVDGLDDRLRVGTDGWPALEPVDLMHRHEAGDAGVLTSLENDLLLARTAPSEYPEAERRRREDLLVATLALGVLRRYSHNGVGVGLTAPTVAERFALLLAGDRPSAAVRAQQVPRPAELAGLSLCCAMHLKDAPATVASIPPLRERLPQVPAGEAVLDSAECLRTIRALRGA
jgi:hypothetical protein